MHYYLYKLNFTTALHVGSDVPGVGLESAQQAIHADTFFSALLNEILTNCGEDELKSWVNDAENGNFVISDLFPYILDKLFIPKPVLYLSNESNDEVLSAKNMKEGDISLKKQLKKLKYLPISKLEEYFGSLKGENEVPLNTDFGIYELVHKTALNLTDKSEPYNVGVFKFKEDAGLYFVAGFKEREKQKIFLKLLESLGFSGIGGKKTSGYGKFGFYEKEICLCDVKDEEYGKYDDEAVIKLKNMIYSNDSKRYILMSVFIPSEEELQFIKSSESCYTLLKRSGFIYSTNFSETGTMLKKKSVVSFAPGSSFTGRMEGRIVNVAPQGNHPIYRYGKGLFLGVNI